MINGRNFSPARLFFVVLLALTFGIQKTSSQQPDRNKPPELGPPPSLRLPAIQHFKLSNGIPVVILEKHELPLVEIELLVTSGGVMDSPEKLGRASLTAEMMEEGAGTRNSLQLADAIDFLGVSLGAFASNHSSGVTLHTPLSKLDSAFALFADMVLRPTFPVEELERKRKERLTTLQQWHDQPGAISSVAYNQLLFGSAHPYGRPGLGNEASLRSMTVDDLRSFYKMSYHADNSSFIVVGDISPKVILAKLEGLFGSWKKGEKKSLSLPAVEQVKSNSIILINKPSSAQSVIRIGRVGAQRMTEDYYALTVLNTVLGGSFSSRLNQNLREEHGYTYGAGSSFDFRPLPGAFTASASVQTDVTDKALVEFMKELKNIMQPVNDTELARAKNYLALGYPGNFQSLASLAGQLSELVVYHLPDDYFDNYMNNIQKVTREDVERVAKKYLDPERMNIVIVGDSQKIKAGITALNLAPLKELTIEEVLGKAPVVTDK